MWAYPNLVYVGNEKWGVYISCGVLIPLYFKFTVYSLLYIQNGFPFWELVWPMQMRGEAEIKTPMMMTIHIKWYLAGWLGYADLQFPPACKRWLKVGWRQEGRPVVKLRSK